MDTIEIVGWVLAVVGVAAAVYFRVTGKASEGDFLSDVYKQQEIVREAVAAAEQLWLTGQIPETAAGGKDPRFVWAFDRVQEILPDISDAQLEMLIEAAVFWAKRGVGKLATE